jgi:hypothetical protein
MDRQTAIGACFAAECSAGFFLGHDLSALFLLKFHFLYDKIRRIAAFTGGLRDTGTGT